MLKENKFLKEKNFYLKAYIPKFSPSCFTFCFFITKKKDISSCLGTFCSVLGLISLFNGISAILGYLMPKLFLKNYSGSI